MISITRNFQRIRKKEGHMRRSSPEKTRNEYESRRGGFVSDTMVIINPKTLVSFSVGLGLELYVFKAQI